VSASTPSDERLADLPVMFDRIKRAEDFKRHVAERKASS
jgi:hypothetical protein